MLIRNYHASDREQVLKLLRLNTPRYFALSEEEDLIDFLAHHIDRYFVAESNGSILACGGFNLAENDEVARISWDIVHPAYQGKGVGSELTSYRISKIQEIATVKTISVRTSQLADSFYAAFGFETKEIIPDFWAEGFDMYRLERNVRLVGNFENAFLEVIRLLNKKSVRHEVNRFPSNAALIDIWLEDGFYVIQFGADAIGFSKVNDDSGFELIPGTFKDEEAFLKFFRPMLERSDN